MSHSRLKLLIGTLGSLLAMQALADDCAVRPGNCGISPLEEIVITGRRMPQLVMESSASISVISAEQLARSTAYGLADAMRGTPGVQITDSGQPGLKRIRIRGEESRRTAILIDGQEITDHWEVGTPLSLHPSMVERIEVVRGSGSVLYGSRALSGVVNFITRKGGDKPFQFEASGGWQSATRGEDWYASAFGEIGGTEYRIAAARSEHGKRDTPDGKMPDTAFDNNSAYAWIGHRFGAHYLAFNYDNYESATEVFVEEEVKTTFPLIDFRIDVPQRDREKFALFYEWEEPTSFLSSIKANVHRQYNDRKFDTFSATLIPGAFPIKTERWIYSDAELEVLDGVLQADWRLGESHSIVSGAQYTKEDVRQDRHVDTLLNGGVRPAEDIHEEASIETVAFFVHDDWQLSERFALNAGARHYHVDGSLDQSTRPGLQPVEHGDRALVAAAGFTFDLSDDTVLRASAAQGYVYPSLLQFATGAYAGSRYANPNPDLDPEHSRAYELGLRTRRYGWALDLGLFHSKSKDYIDHVFCLPKHGCLSSRDKIYINVGESKAYGLELFVAREPGSAKLRPYANLTWMRRSNIYERFQTEDSGTPELAATAGVLFEHQLADEISLWLDLALRGETGSRHEEPSSSGVAVTERKDSWISANLSGGASLGKRQRIDVVVELENLADERYASSTENLLAPGRSISARVSYRFD